MVAPVRDGGNAGKTPSNHSGCQHRVSAFAWGRPTPLNLQLKCLQATRRTSSWVLRKPTPRRLSRGCGWASRLRTWGDIQGRRWRSTVPQAPPPRSRFVRSYRDSRDLNQPGDTRLTRRPKDLARLHWTAHTGERIRETHTGGLTILSFLLPRISAQCRARGELAGERAGGGGR